MENILKISAAGKVGPERRGPERRAGGVCVPAEIMNEFRTCRKPYKYCTI
jgi:hypothetical protein